MEEIIRKISGKSYQEIWLQFRLLEDGWIAMFRLSEEPSPVEWAQIDVPYHTADTIYCLSCILVGYPANVPAPVPAMWLQERREEIGRGLGLPPLID